MTPEQGRAVINRLIDQQAYMMSANDIFYLSALVFLALIGLVWLSRPVRQGADAVVVAVD
jgi:DHA2 family multidrug resistance protein